MGKRKYIFLIALIMPLLIGGKLAIGGMDDVYESHMMKKGMPMMESWEYMKDRLDLTEEQTIKFRKVYTDYRKEVLRKKADLEIAEMELVELLKNKGSNEKVIEESVNKVGSLRSNLNMFRVKSLLKTRDFLSDEQYEDLTNFILRWNRPYRMGGAWPWMYGWDDEQ